MGVQKKKITSIIFDLGGVLIDWNPEYLYSKIFNGDKAKMKWFLENICTFEWNEEQDGGRTIAEATQERVALFPEYKNLIEIYYGRWAEMLGGSIDDTVNILKNLVAQKQYKIVALTNWSDETFPIALERFEFLHWFEDILVSGKEKMRKPSKEIYDLTLNRFGLIPETTVFIDDNLRNIEAAKTLGINCIHFKNPKQLIEELEALGVTV